MCGGRKIVCDVVLHHVPPMNYVPVRRSFPATRCPPPPLSLSLVREYAMRLNARCICHHRLQAKSKTYCDATQTHTHLNHHSCKCESNSKDRFFENLFMFFLLASAFVNESRERVGPKTERMQYTQVATGRKLILVSNRFSNGFRFFKCVKCIFTAALFSIDAFPLTMDIPNRMNISK